MTCQWSLDGHKYVNYLDLSANLLEERIKRNVFLKNQAAGCYIKW